MLNHIDMSVVAVTNGRDPSQVLRFLESYRDQSLSSIEVIVVQPRDDEFFDAVHQLVSDFGAVHIPLAPCVPFSIARCVNVGIRFSRGEHVLRTDIDCLAHADLCRSLVRAQGQSGGKRLILAARRDLPASASLEDFRYRWQDLTISSTQVSELATGSCMCFPREWICAIGGLDERMHEYGWEDTDIQWRAFKDGLDECRLDSMPNEAWLLHAWHLPSATSEEWYNFNERCSRDESVVRNGPGWGENGILGDRSFGRRVCHVSSFAGPSRRDSPDSLLRSAALIARSSQDRGDSVTLYGGAGSEFVGRLVAHRPGESLNLNPDDYDVIHFASPELFNDYAAIYPQATTPTFATIGMRFGVTNVQIVRANANVEFKSEDAWIDAQDSGAISEALRSAYGF